MKDRRPCHNSLNFHLHFWRGFGCDCGLLVARITVGFMSISTGDIDTIFRLNALKKHLGNLRGKSDDE